MPPIRFFSVLIKMTSTNCVYLSIDLKKDQSRMYEMYLFLSKTSMKEKFIQIWWLMQFIVLDSSSDLESVSKINKYDQTNRSSNFDSSVKHNKHSTAIFYIF